MSHDDDDLTPFGFADDPDDRPRVPTPGAAEAPPLTGERLPLPPALPWWIVPTILLAIGMQLCLVPVAVITAKAGIETATMMTTVAAVIVVLQVVFVTAMLTLVGHLFGIEYGPAGQAVVKLAAVVTVVDGLTGVLALYSHPCALLVATILGVGVFQRLFRLAIHEMLVSIAGIVFAAFLLNAVVIMFLIRSVWPW